MTASVSSVSTPGFALPDEPDVLSSGTEHLTVLVAHITKLGGENPASARAALAHAVALRTAGRLGLDVRPSPGSSRRLHYGWSKPLRTDAGAHEEARAEINEARDGVRLRGRQGIAIGPHSVDRIVLLAKDAGRDGGGVVGILDAADKAVEIAIEEPAFARPAIRQGWIRLNRALQPVETRRLSPAQFEDEFLRAALVEELLQAALDHGLLRAFAAQAFTHLTTRSRPWQGQGLSRATDDPHVVRRYGEYVALLDGLTELIAEAEATAGTALDGDRGPLTAAIDVVAAARCYAILVGKTLISGTIELLGAGATSERYGFDVYWRDFTARAVQDVPLWTAAAIGRRRVYRYSGKSRP